MRAATSQLVAALTPFMIAAVPVGSVAQTCNSADRSVLLVMDASGSMNAKLPNGETRIAVAQRAIKGTASLVPGTAKLSLRLYGAQSPARSKNCRDTHLAVPFGPASAAGGSIAASVDAAKAQGYTPIGYSLEQAANDFAADAKERVIVLVSDGKETCKGDPVLAAKALATKGITVHTVGFIVDTAARMQLQNIARATGGSYFDAPLGPELPDTLKSALNACKKQVVKLPAKPKPGKLRITAATYHPVFNAETGQKVGSLDAVNRQLTLPAGIYEVQFGAGRWKGIEVRPNKTTEIAPGELEVKHVEGFSQVVVLDAETNEKHDSLNRMRQRITLMPGLYNLRFGTSDLVWPFVKVDGGKVTKLSLARLILSRDLEWRTAQIFDTDGKKVLSLYPATGREAGLPPGEYVIDVDGNKFPFEADPGEVLEVKPQ
jgi:hypothetical protein